MVRLRVEEKCRFEEFCLKVCVVRLEEDGKGAVVL